MAIMSLGLAAIIMTLTSGFVLFTNKGTTGIMDTTTFTPEGTDSDDYQQPDQHHQDQLQEQPPHQSDYLTLYFASLDPNCDLNPETMKYVGNVGARMWVDPSCFNEVSLIYLFQYLDIPLPNLLTELGLESEGVDKSSESDDPESEERSSSQEIDQENDIVPTIAQFESTTPEANFNHPKRYIFKEIHRL